MTTTFDPATTTAQHGPDDHAAADALVGRLFESAVAALEMLTIDAGLRLGLYAALHSGGALSATELAAATGIVERYAREWLEQQAAADLIVLVGPAASGTGDRRYALPDVHATVLLDQEHPAYFGAAAPTVTGMALTLPAVVDAYRTGTGVPFADYGSDVRHGIGGLNRPMFVNELASTWLPLLPEAHARLRSGDARVLDVGCGTGWSSIALARGFPGVQVTGVDLDPASVAEAREHARTAGVADRVRFIEGDAATHDHGNGYNLVTVFEALHDMSDPVGALRQARAALAPGGVVLVADERTAEDFTAPADPLERFLYACSVLHCLPATMAEGGSTANGTVLRESTVRRWAREAGYRAAAVLPVDNDFWRFYRLDP